MLDLALQVCHEHADVALRLLDLAHLRLAHALERLDLVDKACVCLAARARLDEKQVHPPARVGLEHAAPVLGRLARHLGLERLLLREHRLAHRLRLARVPLLLLEGLLEDRVALGELRLHLLSLLVGHP